MYNPQQQYQQRQGEPSLYFVNSRQEDYSPANYSNFYQAKRSEPIQSIPFKVYVYEQVLTKNASILRLNDASSVIRFELPNQNGRNFSVFERILNEHGLSVQTHKLSYIDEEKDLITLSNERDFQFMLKLFKGQLVKITCERLVSSLKPTVHPLFIQRVPQQQASTRQVPSQKRNEQFPFFEFLTKRSEENSQPDNLLEKALESIVNFDNSSKTKAKRSEQKSSPVRHDQFTVESCPFRRECSSSNNSQQANKQVEEETRKEAPKSRTIEISLSDLLSGAFQRNVAGQQVDEQKKQQESKQAQQSFREYLIEKLKERYSSEEKKASKQSEEHKNEQYKGANQSESEKQTEITETKQESVVEQVSEKNDLIAESTPNTTSLLLSNNLETFSNEITEQSEEEHQSIEEDESSDDETELVLDSIQESPNTKVSTEQLSTEEDTTFQYENELNLLSEMGFSSPNTKLFLKKNNGDIQRTVSELLFVQ